MIITPKEKKIISDLRIKSRKLTQKCYTPNCSNLAIRSHLLQKKGVLNTIASDKNKIVELEYQDLRFNNKTYTFKEKGIIKQKSENLNFWGFCSNCDNKIFKKIETFPVDLSIYQNQLLFSYRGFLNEHNKQQYNIKWHEAIFNSSYLPNNIKDSYFKIYLNQKSCIEIGEIIKKLFENDITSGTKNFEFIYFTLPKFDICTSAVYTIPHKVILNLHHQRVSQNKLKSNMTFINLIPHNNHLAVILGKINDNDLINGLDLKYITKQNEKNKQKIISDILIKHIETWFISPQLLKKWETTKKDVNIIESIHKYLPSEMKSKRVDLNIFL